MLSVFSWVVRAKGGRSSASFTPVLVLVLVLVLVPAPGRSGVQSLL